jgi:uncharacterized protein
MRWPAVARVRSVAPMSGTPAPRTLFPNTGIAVLMVVGYLSAQVLLGFLGGIVAGILGHADPQAAGEALRNSWVLLALMVPPAIGMLALGLHLMRETPREFFRLRPFPATQAPAIVVTALGVTLVLNEIDNVICHLLAVAISPKQLPPDLIDMTAAPAGAFLLVVVAAPWLEEYFFRGIILRGLLACHRTSTAVILNAILFGLIHANIRQFVIGGVIGLIFGWWYARTRSVAPGIIGHMVFNSVAWLAAQWHESAAVLGLSGRPGAMRHEPWWLFVGGAGLLAGGLLLFHRTCPQATPPEIVPTSPPTDEPPLLDQPPLLAPPPPPIP